MATAGDVLTRLNEKLNDAGATRWPDTEHFRGIDDAQQAILESRPDLFEKYAFVATVEGTAQSVPADCYRLFDVVANCDGTDARISGITMINRSVLDRHVRNWMALDANSEAEHWMQDGLEQARFYLVPGQPASGRGKLELRYAGRPTAIASAGTALSLDEEAINAIFNFCMHRALEKDEKFAGSPTAASYMQKFATFLAAKAQADSEQSAVRNENEKG